MKFFVDAQLPEALAVAFLAWGLDATHVRAILPPDCADEAIWHHAIATPGSIIITRDADFVELARRGVGQPRVIWVRIGNCTNARLITLFEQRIVGLIAELDSGRNLIELH